jgi:transcriptional regulator with XRE-family HTH domain
MNKIRELREQRKIGQKVLAAEIGVSQPTISDWEAERKIPSSKNIAAIAKFFGVSMEYILGDDDVKTYEPNQPYIDDNDIKFALFGGDSANITDAQFDEVKRFAQFIRAQKKKEK